MNIISTILIIFVALEFFYIMYLETFATTSRKTSETFNISVSKLKDKNIKVLLKNQGVYNGLIGVLLLYGLFFSSNKRIMRNYFSVYHWCSYLWWPFKQHQHLFQTRHIASVGAHINALVSIGVGGFGGF